MSDAYISKALREKVAAQAHHRCGYCLTSEAIVGTPQGVPKRHLLVIHVDRRGCDRLLERLQAKLGLDDCPFSGGKISLLEQAVSASVENMVYNETPLDLLREPFNLC